MLWRSGIVKNNKEKKQTLLKLYDKREVFLDAVYVIPSASTTASYGTLRSWVGSFLSILGLNIVIIYVLLKVFISKALKAKATLSEISAGLS